MHELKSFVLTTFSHATMLSYDEMPYPVKILKVDTNSILYRNSEGKLAIYTASPIVLSLICCGFDEVQIASDGFLWPKNDIDELFVGRDTIYADSYLLTNENNE